MMNEDTPSHVDSLAGITAYGSNHQVNLVTNESGPNVITEEGEIRNTGDRPFSFCEPRKKKQT